MLDMDSDPYSLFIFAMNAPQTREKYINRLNQFFDFIKLTGSTMEEPMLTICREYRMQNQVEKIAESRSNNACVKLQLLEKEEIINKLTMENRTNKDAIAALSELIS